MEEKQKGENHENYTQAFTPATLIGWLTIIALLTGIFVSVHSSFIKPYSHFIEFERRLTRIEDSQENLLTNEQWIMKRME